MIVEHWVAICDLRLARRATGSPVTRCRADLSGIVDDRVLDRWDCVISRYAAAVVARIASIRDSTRELWLALVAVDSTVLTLSTLTSSLFITSLNSRLIRCAAMFAMAPESFKTVSTLSLSLGRGRTSELVPCDAFSCTLAASRRVASRVECPPRECREMRIDEFRAPVLKSKLSFRLPVHSDSSLTSLNPNRLTQ